jgi:hypothetical protein
MLEELPEASASDGLNDMPEDEEVEAAEGLMQMLIDANGDGPLLWR